MNPDSKILQTPWGPVEVPGIVPQEFECAQCGRCCKGFVLTMRDVDREVWYQRFLKKSEYEYPKDIGAIYHLFENVPEAFSADGEPLTTCRAFDRKNNRCLVFEDAPELRPIACWAFPYNYTWEGLMQFPYPWCSIFIQTFQWMMERFWQALLDIHDPFSVAKGDSI